MRKLFVLVTAAVLLLYCIPAFTAEITAPPTKTEQLVIKGKVINENEKPVAGARVVVNNYQGDSKISASMLTTDKAGRFSFIQPNRNKNANYYMLAVAPGYAYGIGHFNEARAEDVTIILSPEKKFRGRVVDEAGKPIQGATIQVYSINGYRPDGPDYSIGGRYTDDSSYNQYVSSKDGSFVIDHIPAPDLFPEFFTMTLNTSKNGRANVFAVFAKYLNNSTSDSLTITMPKACILEGTLFLPDKSGPAPEGTALWVQLKYRNKPYDVTVGKNGHFRLDALPPGNFSITLAQSGIKMDKDGNPTSTTLPWALAMTPDDQLKPDKPLKVDVVLSKGTLVSGTVVNAAKDQPAEYADLVVKHSGIPETMMSKSTLTTIKDGKFTARVAPGDVTVTVNSVNGSWVGSDVASRVAFKAVDGVDKTDIVIKVDPTKDEASLFTAMNKPIPEDFEIKPGTYELTWDTDFKFRGAYRLASRTNDAAKAAIKLPQLKSEKAIIELYKHDGKLAIAVDESKGTGKGYDTFYVDMNRNLDLTDDKPLTAVLDKSGQILSGWFDIQLNSTPNPAQIEICMFISGDGPVFYIAQKGSWKGKLDTTKGKVDCVLCDENGNGVYNDYYQSNLSNQMSGEGDIVYIDSNGFGTVNRDSYSQKLAIYPITRVGTKFYIFKPNEQGNKLTVEPYSGEIGQLKIAGNLQGANATAAVYVFLRGPNGAYNFSNTSKDTMNLPVGKYKLHYCDMYLSLDSERRLRVALSTDKIVDIKANKAVTAEINGNLSFAINPDVKELIWEPKSTQSLNWVINAGKDAKIETIIGISPTVKLFDKQGNTAARILPGST